MVKVTPNTLLKSTSTLTKRHTNESIEKYLGRLTHLYMDNKNIDEVVGRDTEIHKFIDRGMHLASVPV